MTEQGGHLLDDYFAGFIGERSGLTGREKERLGQLVKALTISLEAGHSCLPVAGDDERLLAAVHLVSDGGQTPLVLHKGKLYLHRYYRYELRLARQLSSMAAVTFPFGLPRAQLDSFFASVDSETDWQKEAANTALTKALTIICGGPGTGKTTTVVKILAMLLLAAEERLDVALAAPTGKAAKRLSEAVGSSLRWLQLPDKITRAIPTQAQTLHRLLGVKQHSAKFRHGHENPMSWDVVVVDEASMVDLAMMSKLVDALKPGARLLLLGDQNQLASVETGAVLGDCINSLPDNTVELKKTYRFDDNIKRLAESIIAGDSARAWAMLGAGNAGNISLLQTDMFEYIGRKYARFMQEAQDPGNLDIREILTVFNRFQVLCGVHYGNRGVEAVNLGVEQYLVQQGFACRPDSWYSGRPVLITRNDYSLDLFNGDIGICVEDSGAQAMQVWFEGADGRLKSYSPYRLPPCETVFAMTIHKSQGSEFDEVVVVLPDDDNRILSRELIYTAVTRAKKAVNVVADREVFTQALVRNIVRHSGLADLLQDNVSSI